jgi:hypothetical protein
VGQGEAEHCKGFGAYMRPRYPRNPIFWKNRISQTFGKIGFLKPLEKSDFSNLWKNRIFQTFGAQEIRFFGKIGFLKPCAQTYHRSPIFWKNRISQTVCPNVPSISDFLEKSDFSNRVSKRTIDLRFFWKNRISFEMEWSGNFRRRVLDAIVRHCSQGDSIVSQDILFILPIDSVQAVNIAVIVTKIALFNKLKA